MGSRPRLVEILLFLTCVVCLVLFGERLGARPADPSPAGGTASAANADPTYQQLRQVGLGGEAVQVNNLALKRDAGIFTFHSGTLCFLSPVGGKVTGAVFVGEGSFSLVPPIAVEMRSLALLTKQPGMKEEFDELVLRFTDSTYDEIKKSPAAVPSTGTCKSGLLDDSKSATRKRISFNLEGRILQDVLSDEPGGLFVAFIRGKNYGKRLVFFIDPHGVPFGLEPEEVALLTYDEAKYGVWSAFHFSSEYKTGQASGDQENAVINIKEQQLDTQIERSGELGGKAVTTFVSRANGLRVLPFDLFGTLRVQSVTGADGQPLSFIQEDKDSDPQFSVILPKALAAGERYSITTVYRGKDAVRNEGGDNYYPVARSNWYPSGRWNDYATFNMSFAIPKGMEMVATGAPIGSPLTEGNQALSKWRSDVPQPVAGFQFGRFKKSVDKITELGNFEVESYANAEIPDSVRRLLDRVSGDSGASGLGTLDQSRMSGAALGTMSTTGMIKKAMAEASLSLKLYSDYFGPIGFKRLAMTQQTVSYYGQSWPEMVYLPIAYFYDTTIRHQLGWSERAERGYFRVVAPHEVAHQWWGHTVGWGSYRDQWMSEGFADFSASLFIQYVWKDRPQEYLRFWNDERELLTERNKEGFRAIDVGPVTLGYRLNNSRAGFDIARDLIYPKGAYILHMIRMMLWSGKAGDNDFKALMQDFVKNYAGRSATTEDFKAMVEKHMTAQMNLMGDGKMDWFFNEYVYGTALPAYALASSITNQPDGTPVLNLKITQSNVDPNFRMLVPVYLEFADGRIGMLGRATLVGNTDVEQQVPLRGLKSPPKRALLNYYNDVLCSK
jgi:hypothetical protein